MSRRHGREEFHAAEILDDSFDELESKQKRELDQLQQVSIFEKDKVPKANEIVNTARDAKKSIYSFKIQAELLAQLSAHNQQLSFNRKESEKVQSKRTLLLDHFRHNVIYDKYSSLIDSFFELSIYSLEKIRQMRKDDIPVNFFARESKPLVVEDNLTFDSRFQSGNLAFVSKQSDRSYNLLLQNDVNTHGYSNWFYFKVSNKTKSKVKFSILNYGKAGWLFNQGMGVLTYSKRAQEKKGEGWTRTHNSVSCFRNSTFRTETSAVSCYNTLTFEYDFNVDEDEVYFSYSIPYTYTDLCSFLDTLEGNSFTYFHRKLLGRSLAGNRLEILTISNGENWRKDSESDNKEKSSQKPAIVIIARSHPGETVSSWILKGFIEFIVSNEPTAIALRDRFIFKIIPMMNPDGVIHGNYRCSLSGRDLNRRWKKPDRNLYPEVYFAKKLICDLGDRRNIELIMDLHGHSRRKKMFMYGCNDWMSPMKCREFPYLLSKFNPNFQYRYCNFLIQKYKQSTARVTLYRKFKIPTIFTLQSSMCGNLEVHFSIKDLKDMGSSIAQVIHLYFKTHNTKKEVETKQDAKCSELLKQLWENEELMKVGNDKDEDSESEPSLDNIPISQINKICLQRQRKSFRTNATIEKARQNAHSSQKDRDKDKVRDRSTNSLSKTAVIIKSSTKVVGNLFEKSINKTTQSWRQQKKPVSARKNLNATLIPSSAPIPMCRQQYQFSKKFISFEQKAARQVRFINFPLVDDFMKLRNFLNKEKAAAKIQEAQSAEKSIHSQNNNSFRLRNFVRTSKNRRFLFKTNFNV